MEHEFELSNFALFCRTYSVYLIMKLAFNLFKTNNRSEDYLIMKYALSHIKQIVIKKIFKC